MLQIPLYYLAPVSYYSRLYRALASGEGYCFDSVDRWEKQTLRSRCFIASAQGPAMLSVPVTHNRASGLTADCLLSAHGNWQHRHWNALVSNYRQSPFFDYYADDFAPHYRPGAHATLWSFNMALHSVVMEHLGLNGLPPTVRPRPSAMLNPYYQVFANRTGFLPDLSVVDLLFNTGPEARLYL